VTLRITLVVVCSVLNSISDQSETEISVCRYWLVSVSPDSALGLVFPAEMVTTVVFRQSADVKSS
jgi:hypothetical protein